MKRKYILIIFIIITSAKLSGDVIIIPPKTANICVRIKNLDDYPNIAVIGLSDCLAFSRSNKSYRVKSNSCLKVSKSCPLTLYAVKKEYIESKNLEKIDWEKDKNVIKSNLTINSKTFNNHDDIIAIKMDFNIVGFSDTSMVLYKTKQILTYSTIGRPDSVEYFSYKGDLSKLHKDLN